MSNQLRRQLAQRLVIDVRNFAETGQALGPVTQLNQELTSFLQEHQLGGVILFSENCQSPEQLRQLTAQLQQTSDGRPLLISIDQEGGRVVRTSREWSTAFAGNMALGACAESSQELAYLSAKAMGDELNALGINVVHAPCVDVNNNPNNPVINIRAYGDNPAQVAALASAACRGFNEARLVPTLKHFPGHGDTAVDSHTGLPRVEHSRHLLDSVELYPYHQLLGDNSQPLMVMTGHLQFPALDSSTVNGQLRPATMSRQIINGLLRQQMGFQGVVISDAMDMAAISELMPTEQAVVEVMAAGVDMVLMPIKIRCREDFSKLDSLLEHLVQAVKGGQLCAVETAESANRIAKLKQHLLPRPTLPLETVGSVNHRQLEQQLADASITALAGQRPQGLDSHSRWLLMLPGQQLLNGMSQALAQCGIDDIKLFDVSCDTITPAQLAQVDIVVAGFVSPRQSAAELGGVDDLSQLDEQALIAAHQPQRLLAPLQLAKQMGQPIVYVSLRTPYDAASFAGYADWVLASYAYQVDSPRHCGASLRALAQVLVGAKSANGRVPVSLAGVEQ